MGKHEARGAAQPASTGSLPVVEPTPPGSPTGADTIPDINRREVDGFVRILDLSQPLPKVAQMLRERYSAELAGEVKDAIAHVGTHFYMLANPQFLPQELRDSLAAVTEQAVPLDRADAAKSALADAAVKQPDVPRSAGTNGQAPPSRPTSVGGDAQDRPHAKGHKVNTQGATPPSRHAVAGASTTRPSQPSTPSDGRGK